MYVSMMEKAGENGFSCRSDGFSTEQAAMIPAACLALSRTASDILNDDSGALHRLSSPVEFLSNFESVRSTLY
jgi:hypothetical protein